MAAQREAEATTRTRTRVREREPGSPGEASDLSPKVAAGSSRTGSYGQKQTRETPASSDEIIQTGEDLLRGVIQEEVERSGDPQAVALSQKKLGGGAQSPPNSDTQRLIECVRRIGDSLDQNNELQSMMEKVDCESPKEVFFKVATGIFEDGKFSWGRVTALFYFAGKLAAKALRENIPKVVKTIMGCAMGFLGSRLLGWIKAQGGWKSLLAYFGTATGKTIAIIAGGALIGALIGAFTGALITSLANKKTSS